MTQSKNKTVLVTGANRGIGYAIAKGMSERGYHVLLGSRDIENGKEAAHKIGGNITAVELDLSSREVTQQHIKTIQSEHPAIDILINNAGVLNRGSLLEVSEDEFYSSMRINFEAPQDIIRMITPHMIENHFGRIVNMSSGWGSFAEGLTGPAAYSISKAALNALTFSLSQHLPKGVKVNAMCPGWVRTRMGGEEASRSPEEGAQTALWLAELPDDGPTGQFFRDKKHIAW